MNRALTFWLILAVAGILAWSEGGAENAGKLVLALDSAEPKLGTMGGQYRPDGLLYSEVVAELYRRKHGREFTVREIVATGGETKTIDMVLASGERLDVIIGYAGRMAKWATPAWAVPLSDYMTKDELGHWIDSALDPYYRAGKLYALPSRAWLQGIVINTDLVQSLGMADRLPGADGVWSMAGFMDIAKAAKAKGLYPLVLFATQPSGDYWQQTWMTGFGAELWKDGHVALDTPEGIAAVEWLVSMLDYAPAGAAGLTYEAMLAGFKGKNTVAVGGSPGGWTNEFAWTFAPPPATPGHRGKLIVGPDSAVVFKTTREPIEAVNLAKILTGIEVQSLWISTAGYYPTIKGTTPPRAWGTGEGKDFIGVKQEDIDRWARGAALVERTGVWDAGIPNTAYSKVRELWLFCLQSVFLKRATVADAVRQFQKDSNAFIDAQ